MSAAAYLLQCFAVVKIDPNNRIDQFVRRESKEERKEFSEYSFSSASSIGTKSLLHYKQIMYGGPLTIGRLVIKRPTAMGLPWPSNRQTIEIAISHCHLITL